MPLAASTRLGPYEILASIGAGGMGEVYRARDTRLQRDVAIKVLPAALSGDADRLRRFEQEAHAAGMLNHPNILAIYDVGTHDGLPYLVSELLQGETLRERQKGSPLAQRKAVDYALQMARGLAAAHQKGLVHRDLKPENLFLTNDGHLKILDFGLAKLIQPAGPGEKTSAPTVAAETDPGVVMGTIGYMSPEQVRGQAADHRTDIFTFGAILYEMLTGRRAFHGESAADVMSAILKEEPPELPEAKIPPGLDRIVRHCLEKRAEDRFQSMRDLGFALEALSAPSGASTTVAAFAPEKKRRLWPVFVALNLAALAALGVLAFRRSQTGPPSSLLRVTFRRGVISGARFAPDGRTIIYSAAWDGKPDAVFSTHPPNPESRAYDFGNAAIRGISSSGEMLLLLDPLAASPAAKLSVGTLAQAPLAGGSPRALIRDIVWADWAPGRSEMAVVRRVGPRMRLECPPGKVLYESAGLIAAARFSPQGDRIAFFDLQGSDRTANTLQVIDLAGKAQVLTRDVIVFSLAWVPDGKEIWISGVWHSPPALYGIDMRGKARPLLRLGAYQEVQDISRDGSVLLVAADDRASMFARTPSDSAERDLAWLNWSTPRDLSDDGRMLLFDETHEGGASTGSVYLRKTDGSPPVRLGDGTAGALSPDGQWAASVTFDHRLLLLPVGAGEARNLRNEGLAFLSARWFQDGRRLLVQAAEKNRPPRLFVRDLTDNGAVKSIAPEGASAFAISPDGKRIVARAPDGQIVFYPAEGGDAQPVPHLSPGDLPVRFGTDTNALFVSHSEGTAVRIYRLDLATGRRDLAHDIRPADLAGANGAENIVLSVDGKTYAYQMRRFLSNLYLIEGLR